jgi:hypothetical protein
MDTMKLDHAAALKNMEADLKKDQEETSAKLKVAQEERERYYNEL